MIQADDIHEEQSDNTSSEKKPTSMDKDTFAVEIKASNGEHQSSNFTLIDSKQPQDDSSLKEELSKKSKHKQCQICIEKIEDECITQPCNHAFCHECILQWMRQKQRCPLCNTQVFSLLWGEVEINVSDIVDGVIQENQGNDDEGGATAEQEHFECLDHNYLGHEVEKLLYKLDFVMQQMEKAGQKHEEFHWFVAEQIESEIEELEDIVKQFGSFDPQHGAQRCIQLEKHLDAIRNNKWNVLEDDYADLYAVHLQNEEEEYYSQPTHNSKNQNAGKSSTKKKQQQYFHDDEEDDFDSSSGAHFPQGALSGKDFSVKNFKPKAKKSSIGVTAKSFPKI